MKRISGVLVGVVLLLVGVVYALDIFNVVSLNLSFDGWWALFIIIPALSELLKGKNIAGSTIMFMLGLYLFMGAQGIISFGIVWKLFLVSCFIVIGIKCIIKGILPCNEASDDEIHTANVKNISKDGNRAARVGAIFGGAKCNLCDIDLSDMEQIDLLCFFGGADIIVPENVTIKINAFCLFGGISDKRKINENVKKDITLTVNGFCMFGGADIK